jgi:hypothetical protein
MSTQEMPGADADRTALGRTAEAAIPVLREVSNTPELSLNDVRTLLGAIAVLERYAKRHR